MINQSVFCIELTTTELKSLVDIKAWNGGMWDSPPNQNIVNIKNKIRGQLTPVQECCAYCGLKLGGTSKGQIEHIAPKANFRYPQFTFTLKNLVMACNYCNGFDKKSTKDTIVTLNRLYAKCEFSIVHPYFDNPDDHFEWDDNQIQILISIKNGSLKAKTSIELFELASTKMSVLRAQEVRYNELVASCPLEESDEELINEILQK